jgi:hypothetical protein
MNATATDSTMKMFGAGCCMGVGMNTDADRNQGGALIWDMLFWGGGALEPLSSDEQLAHCLHRCTTDPACMGMDFEAASGCFGNKNR